MAGQPPRPAWMRYPTRAASVSFPDPVDPPPAPIPVSTRPPLRPMFTFRIPNTTTPAPAPAPVVVAPPQPRPRVTVIEPLPPTPPVVAPIPVLVAPPPPQPLVEYAPRWSPPPVSPVAAPSPRRPPSPPPLPPIMAPAPQPSPPPTSRIAASSLRRSPSPPLLPQIIAPVPQPSPPPMYPIAAPPPRMSPSPPPLPPVPQPSPPTIAPRSPRSPPPQSQIIERPSPTRSPVTAPAPRPLTSRSSIPAAAPVPPLSVRNPSLAPPPSPMKDSNFMKSQSSPSPDKSPLPKINSPPPKTTTPPIQKPSETVAREAIRLPQLVKSVDEARLRSNNNGVPEIEQKNVLVQQKIHKPMETPEIHDNGNTSNGNRDQKSKGTYKKPSPEEQGMRVITLAGENKGAVMEFGTNHSKVHTLESAAKCDGDQSGKSVKDEEMKKKSMAIQIPFTSFLNSNVQGLNNSIMYNCCFRNNDPGIHLYVTKFPNRRRESKE